jgi:hypothetical protein
MLRSSVLHSRAQLGDPPGAALGEAPRPSYGPVALAAVAYCREDENPSKTDVLNSVSKQGHANVCVSIGIPVELDIALPSSESAVIS